MRSQLIPSVAVLVGTIVGAGFLGIPYVVSKSGFIIGAIHILVIGLIMLLTNLYLGEVSLRTEGNHQLTGYAEKYLGKTGKTIMLISIAFLILSALLAYTIGISQSISFLISQNFDFELPVALVFLVLMTITTFFGLATFKKGETAGLFIMGALLIGIIVIFAPQIETSNLTTFHPEFAFAPFGIILFSFLSLTALPELERILEFQNEKMKKAVLIGSVLPIVGYFLFTMVVIGYKGLNVPEVATLSLGNIFILLGIVTMATSYIALAYVLKSVLHFDYNLKRVSSWLIVSLSSVTLYFLATKLGFTFSAILEVAGTVAGSLTGILILLMVGRSKKHGDRNPEYSIPLNILIIAIIALFFIAGTAIAFLT